jgi:DNA repair protein RecN (Recombination protein N)
VENKAAVKLFLNNNELDNEDELVLRREISNSGKSRGFINDTPATLQQLKELTSLLVDLHQQFDTLELGDSDFQREVLDALAGNQQLLLKYQENYRDWQRQKNEFDQLVKQKETFSKEFDYHQYIFNELDQLNLKENELEDLEVELKLLTNSEGIKTALTKVYGELNESEHPLVQQIKILTNQLQSYAEYHQGIPAIIERLRSAQVELQDIADEVEQLNNHVNFDQERIEQINEKLSAGYKLLKKHNVQTTNQLIAIKDDLADKLNAVLNIDELISTKEQQVKDLHTKCEEAAKEISGLRKSKIPMLEKKVNALLQQVGMPNARLKVQVQPTTLHLCGNDDIEFLFDANKSNRFTALRKVASGGELSRLMLCIKSLVAQSIDLPTLIFDEIDTGISGEAARQVGVIMKELALSRQLITITHQPQIAGKADAHYFVYKEIKGDAIKTNIKHLSSDERIITIAKMLSGEKPTAAALENAREMMN